MASLGSRRGPQPRRPHCVIGALLPPAHAHLSAERAVAAVAHGPCAVTGPQRLCTARTAGAQASARQLQGPARSTQTNWQRSVRPRAVLTACCGPVCSQVHYGGLAHPFTGASRTSSSSSRLTSTAGSSRGGASRRGRSAWVGLAHVLTSRRPWKSSLAPFGAHTSCPLPTRAASRAASAALGPRPLCAVL